MSDVRDAGSRGAAAVKRDAIAEQFTSFGDLFAMTSEGFGARWWIRTTDPRRVKAMLYR